MKELEPNFNNALMNVINELKAPKGQYNNFGKYKYRNAEDIIDAVKPLLFAQGLRMKISDVVELIGERYYVKATVTVTGYGESDETTAYAREAEEQKGMNDAQITGSTSSYARKYALNGMFDIDDTKDADTNEYRTQVDAAPKGVRNRQEEAKQGSEKMGEPTEDVLKRAKVAIFNGLNELGYEAPVQQKAFITKVIGKSTIDTISEAEAVDDAIFNEKDNTDFLPADNEAGGVI